MRQQYERQMDGWEQERRMLLDRIQVAELAAVDAVSDIFVCMYVCVCVSVHIQVAELAAVDAVSALRIYRRIYTHTYIHTYRAEVTMQSTHLGMHVDC